MRALLSRTVVVDALVYRNMYIRDRNPKLSAIAPNFARFCFVNFYGCGPSKNCTQTFSPASGHIR